MSVKFERRSLSLPVEMRARGDKVRVISGYAAIFYRAGDAGTEYQLWDKCIERIHPGAFDAALREDDVRGLFDHRTDRVLGRREPGNDKPTMRLSIDDRGLKYEIDLPDSEAGIAELITRKDITGSSFGFSCYTEYGAKRGRIAWEEINGVMYRNIYDLTLYDAGPVTFAAYEGTTAEARSALTATIPEPQPDWADWESRLLLADAELRT